MLQRPVLVSHCRRSMVCGGSVLSRRLTTPTTNTTSDRFVTIPKSRLDELILSEATALANSPQTFVTMADMVRIGSHMDQAALMRTSRFLHRELAIRYAIRVKELEMSPAWMSGQEEFGQIKDLYMGIFRDLRLFPPPTLESHIGPFTDLLLDIRRKLSVVPLTLSRGVQNLKAQGVLNTEPDRKRHEYINEHLDIMLSARIGTQLLIDQQLELSHQVQAHTSTNEKPATSFVGTIDTKCNPFELCMDAAHEVAGVCEREFGVAPPIVVDGAKDLTFSYIPSHLHYIVIELLKNACRATVEHAIKKHSHHSHHDHEHDHDHHHNNHHNSNHHHDNHHNSNHHHDNHQNNNHHSTYSHGHSHSQTIDHVTIDADTLSPVRVTIANCRKGKEIGIEVADQGGGIPRQDIQRVWWYSFTTVKHTQEIDINRLDKPLLAGLGFGLPMSRLYAKYFGGDLAMLSLSGHGTTCHVYLNRLGNASEHSRTRMHTQAPK